MTIPTVMRMSPAGPGVRSAARPRRRSGTRCRARRRRPNRIRSAAAVSKSATTTAAIFRARKTRSERRSASTGPTSPSDDPGQEVGERRADARRREHGGDEGVVCADRRDGLDDASITDCVIDSGTPPSARPRALARTSIRPARVPAEPRAADREPPPRIASPSSGSRSCDEQADERRQGQQAVPEVGDPP